jgi:hypothetical protein
MMAAVAGLHAQQTWVSTDVQQPPAGGPVQLKPPALLKQFVGGGRWQSRSRIESLSDRAIAGLNHWFIGALSHWVF